MRFPAVSLSTWLLVCVLSSDLYYGKAQDDAAAAAAATTTCASSSSSSAAGSSAASRKPPPLFKARVLRLGQVVAAVASQMHQNNNADTTTTTTMMALEDVFGCCAAAVVNDGDALTLLIPQKLGEMPQMTTEQTLEVLEEAKAAWNGGMGAWPQMSLSDRLEAMERFLSELHHQRDVIVEVLMWEIGKNRGDAESEFDRTIQFAEQVMEVCRTDDEMQAASWQTLGATRALVRRAAVGIVLALGPYNYPLNETYATILPALLMGNVVILKIPTVGGLAHLLTMEAFSKALPPGAINFVSGRGRATMPPMMASGAIDGLAFIGGSNAADDLIRQHPHPHRLKVFLQLEANNMGIFLPDVFDPSNEALLESSLDEAVAGSLSFNGQRCTALKLLLVPAAHAELFAHKFAQRVEALSVGLPWTTTTTTTTGEDGSSSSSFSKITPLPNQKRVSYMKQLIDDATAKGAKIVNQNGGKVIGGPESTLMVPAVLFPVTSEMNIYHEEQFGPVVPIAPYDDIDSVIAFARDGDYAQQVSIFTTSQNDAATAAAALVDQFSSVFGKININSQCGRSPDTLPFSGRRSSAMGVMSVRDSLREFSIPTVVSYKNNKDDDDDDKKKKKNGGDMIVAQMQKSSNFLKLS